MNCERFRHLIDAFAGGELDAGNDPDALQHFNACERCAAEADGIRQLKRTLTRVFAEDVAPAALRERIHRAIESERDATPIPIRRRYRWVAPLGMAAAIAFVWLIYPLAFDKPASPTSGAAGPVDVQWVSAVERRHNGCVALGRAHHRASLTRDVRKIRVTLSKELNLTVLAPDLTDAGFRFHSADACGIGSTRGAHIVYERVADGLLFSLFSIPRQSHLVPESGARGSPRAYSASRTVGGLSVISWHNAATTYVLCGKSSSNELKSLAGTVG